MLPATLNKYSCQVKNRAKTHTQTELEIQNQIAFSESDVLQIWLGSLDVSTCQKEVKKWSASGAKILRAPCQLQQKEMCQCSKIAPSSRVPTPADPWHIKIAVID